MACQSGILLSDEYPRSERMRAELRGYEGPLYVLHQDGDSSVDSDRTLSELGFEAPTGEANCQAVQSRDALSVMGCRIR
jgi:hypothetical protein